MPSDTFKGKDVIIHPQPKPIYHAPAPLPELPEKVRVLQYAVDFWQPHRRRRFAFDYNGQYCALGVVKHAEDAVKGCRIYGYDRAGRKYLGMAGPVWFINDWMPYGQSLLYRWMKYRLWKFKRQARKGKLR